MNSATERLGELKQVCGSAVHNAAPFGFAAAGVALGVGGVLADKPLAGACGAVSGAIAGLVERHRTSIYQNLAAGMRARLRRQRKESDQQVTDLRQQVRELQTEVFALRLEASAPAAPVPVPVAEPPSTVWEPVEPPVIEVPVEPAAVEEVPVEPAAEASAEEGGRVIDLPVQPKAPAATKATSKKKKPAQKQEPAVAAS